MNGIFNIFNRFAPSLYNYSVEENENNESNSHGNDTTNVFGENESIAEGPTGTIVEVEGTIVEGELIDYSDSINEILLDLNVMNDQLLMISSLSHLFITVLLPFIFIVIALWWFIKRFL